MAYKDGSSSLTVAGAALAFQPTSHLAPDIGFLENRNATDCSLLANPCQGALAGESGKPRQNRQLRLQISAALRSGLARGALTLIRRILYSERTFRCPIHVIGLNRESGESPELPRSGKQERKLLRSTGSAMNWEAGASR